MGMISWGLNYLLAAFVAYSCVQLARVGQALDGRIWKTLGWLTALYLIFYDLSPLIGMLQYRPLHAGAWVLAIAMGVIAGGISEPWVTESADTLRSLQEVPFLRAFLCSFVPTIIILVDDAGQLRFWLLTGAPAWAATVGSFTVAGAVLGILAFYLRRQWVGLLVACIPLGLLDASITVPALAVYFAGSQVSLSSSPLLRQKTTAVLLLSGLWTLIGFQYVYLHMYMLRGIAHFSQHTGPAFLGAAIAPLLLAASAIQKLIGDMHRGSGVQCVRRQANAAPLVVALRSLIVPILYSSILLIVGGALLGSLWGSNFWLPKNAGFFAAVLLLVLAFVAGRGFLLVAGLATAIGAFEFIATNYYGAWNPSVGGVIRTYPETPMLQPWTWSLWFGAVSQGASCGGVSGFVAGVLMALQDRGESEAEQSAPPDRGHEAVCAKT